MEVGISDDLINVLKYGYTNDPENQMMYSQAADYLRGLNQTELTPLRGADMPLPTGFNPQTLDFNQMMLAIEPYKENTAIYKTLTDAIQRYVTQETPTEPTGATGVTGEPTEELDVFGMGSPFLSEEQLETIGEAASGEAGAGIDTQTEILTAVLGEYENVEAEMLTPEQILKMAQDAGALNFDTIISGIETSFNSKKVSMENEKGEVNAAYAGAYDTIQRAIRASRMRSKADMNARGLFFSGVLSRALAGIEIKGLELIGKTAAEKAAKLAAIANNVAVLTSNFEQAKLTAEGSKAAYIGLTYMNMLTDNKKEKQAINMIMAKLKGEIKGLEISKPSIMEAAKQKAMGIAQDENMEQYIAFAKLATTQYQAITTRLHNMNMDDLAGKTFEQNAEKDSFYMNLALNEFAYDMMAGDRNYDLSASNLQLQWDKLGWDQQKYYLNIAKEKELASITKSAESIWDKPFVDMSIPELQDFVGNIEQLEAFITIYNTDKNGNRVDVNGRPTTDPKEWTVKGTNRISYFGDETFDETGEITSPSGGQRAQFNKAMGVIWEKSESGTQDLETISYMNPEEFYTRLREGPIKNAENLVIPEQLVAYTIARSEQFNFDNEDSVDGMWDFFYQYQAQDKSDHGGYTIDWMTVIGMIFGSDIYPHPSTGQHPSPGGG